MLPVVAPRGDWLPGRSSPIPGRWSRPRWSSGRSRTSAGCTVFSPILAGGWFLAEAQRLYHGRSTMPAVPSCGRCGSSTARSPISRRVRGRSARRADPHLIVGVQRLRTCALDCSDSPVWPSPPRRTGWAFAGGAGAPVVTLVLIGVVLALADAAVWSASWRRIGPRQCPAGRRLPPQPWGALVAASGGHRPRSNRRSWRAQPSRGSRRHGRGCRRHRVEFRRHAGSTFASGHRADRSPAPGVRASARRRGGAAGGRVTSRRWGRLVPGCSSSPQTGRGPTSCSASDALEIAALARIELREPDDPTRCAADADRGPVMDADDGFVVRERAQAASAPQTTRPPRRPPTTRRRAGASPPEAPAGRVRIGRRRRPLADLDGDENARGLGRPPR